jgi:hypothetical protein
LGKEIGVAVKKKAAKKTTAKKVAKAPAKKIGKIAEPREGPGGGHKLRS